MPFTAIYKHLIIDQNMIKKMILETTKVDANKLANNIKDIDENSNESPATMKEKKKI